MLVVQLVILTGLVCVCYTAVLTKICEKANGNFLLTAQVDLEGDVLEYITFLDSNGVELKDTCGTPAQFTGSGTSGDPYSITITVNPNAINTGSPDCGHTASGNVLTWRILVVNTLGPLPGTIGRQFDRFLECDFDTITENPSVGVGVNVTEELKVVVLTYTSLALEFSVVKESLLPYGPNEPYQLGDVVRLRIRSINNITGLYGYNCAACNTPTCDDLVFPIFDSRGCKSTPFTSILGPASAEMQPSNVGTYMIGHVTTPIDFSAFAGMAFTEGFTLFQFVGSKEVYFTINVGYCADPADPNCVKHCEHVQGKRRKRREMSPDKERVLAVITVDGENEHLIIDYPRKAENRMNITSVKPEDCLEKPEYIGALAGLGTMVLGASLLALTFGIKLTRMTS